MANQLTNYGKGNILSDYISGKTFKLMLLTDSHTPDIDAEEFIDDVSANEVSGTGYTAGGETVTTVTVTVDDTNDRAYIDADDVTWSTATITARYAYLYVDTGTPSTSEIVGYYDYTENKSSSAGLFTHSFTAGASGGVLYLS